MRTRTVAGLWLLASAAAVPVGATAASGAPAAVATALVGEDTAAAAFRRATALLQAGDLAAAQRIYAELAAGGHESPSLYWNWAQAAQRRGAPGEAMWALLRARELDPADRAVRREIERLRELCGLDPAELDPQPLASLVRWGRRLHLDAVAVALAVLSVLFHALARWRSTWRWPVRAAWAAGAAALLAAAAPLAAALIRPTAVVVRRGAPLADAASATATTVATLREGEVVPVLEVSAAALRVQDSAGARGWARTSDVWRLDRPPMAE